MALSDESPLDKRCQTLLEKLCIQQSTQDHESASQTLATFRILTREKKISQHILDSRCIETLVEYSKQGQIEAQKCLSNLILNYAHIREVLIHPYTDCVEQRLKGIIENRLREALCSESRINIRDQLLELLLKVTLLEAEQFRKDNYLLIIESLKTLFNLTMVKCVDINLVANLIKKLFSLVGTDSDQSEKHDGDSILEHTDKLLVNLIHLLTNMPEEVYSELSEDDADKVLNHLEEQLKAFSSDSFRDTVLPVLNTCANICRHRETTRHRWFEEIIGSTSDFEKRPEEYDTLRGRLVKLMTSVDVHMKEMAAEFLHALCGGDTEKFITYTGFGNSAAFLATKGLLTGSSKPIGDDESKSEDREYRELRKTLDLMTGKVGQPKKDPMEGMTDEEKEWHANELAEVITKLSKLGAVKPMQVNSRGELSELCPSSGNESNDPNKDESSDRE